MKRIEFTTALLSLFATTTLGAYVGSAHADTLSTHTLGSVTVTNAPTRGMNMAQVEKHYGAPSQKLPVAGGDTALHPPINRWVYGNYIVYFERNIVLTSVATGNPDTYPDRMAR